MSTTLDRKSLIQWAITIIGPLLVLLIPTSGGFSWDIKIFFTITAFIILVVAFELLDLVVSVIMLPTLYVLSGITDAATAFSPWTLTVTWLIVGTFVLTAALEECGLLKRIAYWCIKRCGGTYTGTLYGLFVVGIILAWVTFCNAYMIVISLSYGICKAMGYKRGKESAIIMMVGSLGVTSVMCFVYNPLMMGLMEQGARLVVPDFTMTWYNQIFICAPMLICYFLFIFVLTKIYKTKNFTFHGGKEYFEQEYASMGKLTVQEKKAAVILFILMVYLLSSPIHGYSSDYGFMFLPYLMFVPGINVASNKALKSLNFGAICFCVACFSIGTVGVALGLDDLISSSISPVLSNTSSITILYTIMIFGIIANLCLTPSAMMTCLPPVVASVVIGLGMDPIAPLFALYYSTDMVFLPHEVPALLILFTFGMISMKDFIVMNGIKVGIMLVFIGIIMIPYWMLIGVF